MKKRFLITTLILVLFSCFSFIACEHPHHHSLVKHLEKAATCIAEGHREYWNCSECGKNFADSEGKTELSQNEIVIAISSEHNYGDWKITVPTLTETGAAERECLDCDDNTSGHFQSATLPVLTDTRYEVTNNTANCSSAGTATYTITLQKGTFSFSTTSAVNPNKHSTKHYNVKAATCIEPGNTEYWQCTACEKFFSDEDCVVEIFEEDLTTPVLGHSYGEWQITTPTLIAEGSAVKACSACTDSIDGHSVSVTLPVLTDSRYEITGSTATCNSYGTADYTIELEEGTFTFNAISEIAPENHNPQHHIAQPAACVESGNNEYWQCEYCNKFFAAEDCSEEIFEKDWFLPATGHSYGDWELTLPTMEEVGKELKTCSNCSEDTDGHFLTIELPTLDDQKYVITNNTAKCEEAGTATYTITLEEEEFIFDTFSPALGHTTTSEWKVEEETHYLDRYRCSRCFTQVPAVDEAHIFANGKCKVCGFDEPKSYADDNNGLIVVYDMTEYWDYKVAVVTLSYIENDNGQALTAQRIFFTDIYEAGYSVELGTLWTAQFDWDDVKYELAFYCDFENGNTFKLYSFSKVMDFTVVDGDDTYKGSVLQSYYKTSFGFEKYSLFALNLEINETDISTIVKFDVDAEWISVYYEADGQAFGFIFNVTYDEDGWAQAVTIDHVHAYGNWEITVPTMDSEGTATITCSTCDEAKEGHMFTVTLPTLDSDKYTLTNNTATCEEDGTATYTIILDSKTITFEAIVLATGHDFSGKWEYDEFKHYSVHCVNCDEVKDEEGAHNFVDGKCEVCGFMEPKKFVDEANENSYILISEIDGEIYATFVLDYVDGDDSYTFTSKILFEDISDVAGIGQWWSATLNSGDEEFYIYFICDFENGNSFELYALTKVSENTDSEDM